MPALPPALRALAASCCPSPASMPDRTDQADRPVVRGGGPARRLHHQQPGGTLEQALRHQCLPGMTSGHRSVRGGGPAILVGSGMAMPQADPALVALAGLLADAAPPAARTSTLRQLAGRLAELLAMSGERVTAAMASRRGDSAAIQADADMPAMPTQPPPLGPRLTLDPQHGTIVDGSGGHDAGDGATAGDPSIGIGVPSAWQSIAGMLSRPALTTGLRDLVDRVDALLAELGVTRLHLLVLLVVAPVATAFLIDVVVRIAGGG